MNPTLISACVVLGVLLFAFSFAFLSFLLSSSLIWIPDIAPFICVLGMVLGLGSIVVPLEMTTAQGKQDIHEVFVLTEGRKITSVEYVNRLDFRGTGIGALTIVYMNDDKEVTYENPRFCGEVNTELSKDNNYHIGTKKERDNYCSHITIFEPETNQVELYVSK